MRFAAFCLVVLAPSLVQAWGGTGHRIVCEVATQELTTPVRIEVNRLMGELANFDSFTDACNFPDCTGVQDCLRRV